jgi:hypothetical protein
MSHQKILNPPIIHFCIAQNLLPKNAVLPTNHKTPLNNSASPIRQRTNRQLDKECEERFSFCDFVGQKASFCY